MANRSEHGPFLIILELKCQKEGPTGTDELKGCLFRVPGCFHLLLFPTHNLIADKICLFVCFFPGLNVVDVTAGKYSLW